MAQAWGNDGQPVHYRVVGDQTGYPVVLLHGLGLAGDFWADVPAAEEDCLMPLRNSELLAEVIPGAHFEVAVGVGHGIPILDREAVGRAVSRLRQLQLSPAAP